MIQSFSPAWRTTDKDPVPIAEFTRIGGPGPVTLDFAGGANPIEFGYALLRPNFESGDTFRHARFHLEIDAILPPMPADFDLDRMVDGDDLAKWIGDFGMTDGSDADSDGDSDGQDFLIWQRQLGAMGVTSKARAMPEPSTLILLIAILCVPRRRRRYFS